MNATLARRTGDRLLPICMAVMDGCWLYLIFWFVGEALSSSLKLYPVPSPALLAALELASWLISAYLLNRTGLPMNAIQVLSGAVGLVSAIVLVVATNPAFDANRPLVWVGAASYAIIVCLALWIVGAYRASKPPSFDAAYATFRAGLVAVSAFTLLWLLVGGQYIASRLADQEEVYIWFFVAALAALVLGNREAVREGAGRTEAGSWIAMSVGAIAVVIGVGLVAGLYNGRNPLDIAQRLLGTLITIVALAIFGVLYVIGWLISLLGIKLEPFKAPKSVQQMSATPLPSPTPPWQSILKQPDTGSPALSISPELVAVVAGALLLLVVVLVTGRLVKRTQRQTRRNAAEERESLGLRNRLAEQLANLVNRLMGKLRPRAAETASPDEDDLAALRRRSDFSGSLSVRQIYARLQALGSLAGYPRAPQVTPVEWLSVLSSAIPDRANDLKQITSAYLHARYDATSVPTSTVAAVNDAWKRVEAALQPAIERNSGRGPSRANRAPAAQQ